MHSQTATLKKFPWKKFSVCNFQYMKRPVELNSLFSKFLFYHLVWYITWLDTTTLCDLQTRPLRKILLFIWKNNFFRIIAWRFKNYKLFLYFSLKKSTLKKVLLLQEMELTGITIKNFLIFSQQKLFLYFRKWNFLYFRRELSEL